MINRDRLKHHKRIKRNKMFLRYHSCPEGRYCPWCQETRQYQIKRERERLKDQEKELIEV